MNKFVLLWLITVSFLTTEVVDANGATPRVVSASFIDVGDPSSGPLLSTSYAGVPPSQYSVPTGIQVSNWNNLPLIFQSVPGSNLDLRDSQGFLTSVDVDWIGTDVLVGAWTGGILSGDSTMMNGAIQSTLQAPTDRVEINVSDLAASFDLHLGYDVIIYADQDGVGGRQSFFVDDGFTLGAAITMLDVVTYGPNPRAFDPALDYDEGTTDGAGTWLRFSGLSGPSFTIESLAIGNSPAFINGFQIVGYDSTPPKGDFDGDSLVTGSDFLEWQRGYHGGIYTKQELTLWQNNFGHGTPVVPMTHAVPEPKILTLLIAALTIAMVALRPRQYSGRKKGWANFAVTNPLPQPAHTNRML